MQVGPWQEFRLAKLINIKQKLNADENSESKRDENEFEKLLNAKTNSYVVPKESQSDGAVFHSQPRNAPFVQNAKNMVMKRNETKVTLPTMKTEQKSNMKKKKKKKTGGLVPVYPSKNHNDIKPNMAKMDMYNSTAVDSDFSNRPTDLTDARSIDNRSIDQSTVNGTSKGSSGGGSGNGSQAQYKLNQNSKMRRVDEKQYDKLTCVIGDYRNIKPKSVKFPKSNGSYNGSSHNLSINASNDLPSIDNRSNQSNKSTFKANNNQLSNNNQNNNSKRNKIDTNDFNKQFYGDNQWGRQEYDDKVQQKNKNKVDKKIKDDQEKVEQRLQMVNRMANVYKSTKDDKYNTYDMLKTENLNAETNSLGNTAINYSNPRESKNTDYSINTNFNNSKQNNDQVSNYNQVNQNPNNNHINTIQEKELEDSLDDFQKEMKSKVKLAQKSKEVEEHIEQSNDPSPTKNNLRVNDKMDDSQHSQKSMMGRSRHEDEFKDILDWVEELPDEFDINI